MAITPKEALGSKLEAEQQAIEAFETKCEEKLRADYDGRSSVTVGADQVSWFVIQEVQKRFQVAGWNVKYTDSQRDGAFLTFSANHGVNDDRP